MNYRDFARLLDETGETPCMAYPDAFFLEYEDGAKPLYTMARQLCQSCPIRLQCLEYALENNEEVGFWGGMSPRERKGISRGRAA